MFDAEDILFLHTLSSALLISFCLMFSILPIFILIVLSFLSSIILSCLTRLSLMNDANGLMNVLSLFKVIYISLDATGFSVSNLYFRSLASRTLLNLVGSIPISTLFISSLYTDISFNITLVSLLLLDEFSLVLWESSFSSFLFCSNSLIFLSILWGIPNTSSHMSLILSQLSCPVVLYISASNLESTVISKPATLAKCFCIFVSLNIILSLRSGGCKSSNSIKSFVFLSLVFLALILFFGRIVTDGITTLPLSLALLVSMSTLDILDASCIFLVLLVFAKLLFLHWLRFLLPIVLSLTFLCFFFFLLITLASSYDSSLSVSIPGEQLILVLDKLCLSSSRSEYSGTLSMTSVWVLMLYILWLSSDDIWCLSLLLYICICSWTLYISESVIVSVLSLVLYI